MRNKKILVVDGDITNLELTAAVLHQEGYVVLISRFVKEAAMIMRVNHENLDVIIITNSIEKSGDGRELIEEALMTNPLSRIIWVSDSMGPIPHKIEEEIRDIGVRNLLPADFDRRDLVVDIALDHLIETHQPPYIIPEDKFVPAGV